MFGAGTACVVSPVSGIYYNDEMLNIPTMDNPQLTNRFMKELLDIQVGVNLTFKKNYGETEAVD